MKIRSLVISLLLSVALLSASFWGVRFGFVKAQGKNALASETQTVTVGQMADFLSTKKEHYPLSDQFMERYQQTSGGYLDNAKKAGITVDRRQHSPNQKWHFFESWYYPSIADGTLSREEDAKSRIYTKLLCPELLLWIYEACGVSPVKVRAAMDAAVLGKTSGAAVTTIAKNMRGCVAWEDLAAAFQTKVPAESVYLDKTEVEIKVGENADITAVVSPSNATDGAIWSTSGEKEIISITQKSNGVTVKGIKEGVATLTVFYNENVFAEITVTVLKGEQVVPPIGEEGAYNYNIAYDLGTRVTAKQIETNEEIFTTFVLSENGSGIITSVSDAQYIYGGANGGRGDTAWHTGDILKFGTTNVNGSLTLNLSSAANYIKITGYVYDSACKLLVCGNEFSCNEMNEVSKEIVEGGQVSTVLITFESSNLLTIATTNKKPLFITSIEIGYDETLAQ